MNQTLKKNAYKWVTLQQNDSGQLFVGKAYSNQGAEQDRNNTRYIEQALRFFHGHFSDFVRIPKLLGVDLDKCEIQMEYLPHLPKAKYLRLADLSKASALFHACYQQKTDAGFLRGIDDSVIITPKLTALLESHFPLALGFKGDLSENLVFGGGELILADIDSICLEPLGLSELLMYADQFSSSWLMPALRAWLSAPPPPVAFEYLTRPQANALVEATLEVLSARMSSVPKPLRRVKHRLARGLFSRLLSRAAVR